jgi:Arc/MetJ-type ribon-helix-helix transcriptional regulator
MIDAIDRWRAKQKPIPNVSEAIRILVRQSLASAKPASRRSAAASKSASDMAGHEIDKLADGGASDEEQASRKRRLLKGPKEFREMRAKAPKGKRT